VALEIFGLIFLIIKLTAARLFWLVVNKVQQKLSNRVDVVRVDDAECSKQISDHNSINSVETLASARKEPTAQLNVRLNRTFYQ
jgi:hypothetical protein